MPKRKTGPSLWRRPGVWVFLVAFGMAVGGLALVFQARREVPVEEASLDGLSVRLDRASWVDHQMDHEPSFPRPTAMMPGMPERGYERLAVELALTNPTRKTVRHEAEEFVLWSSVEGEHAPSTVLVDSSPLTPGQTLHTVVYFDVETLGDLGRLRLLWRRGDGVAYLPVPHPPAHHARPRGDVSWPADGSVLLPIGSPERGKAVYGAFGCSACHGDPSTPGTQNVGPHLGAVATAAATRIPGKPAVQYLYESVLEPGAFLAPECGRGEPCRAPTAMPEYAEILSLQQMADLVVFLTRQTGVERPAVPDSATTGT